MSLMLAASLLAFSAARAAEAIRVVGSDLFTPGLEQAVQRFAERNELVIKLRLDGSRPGRAQLEAGRADLALVVMAPDAPALAGEWVSLPLAYHTAVVVVPQVVPLTQITFPQLTGIFGTEADAAARRWGELGPAGEWDRRQVLAHVAGPAAGLAADLLRHEVLRSPALKPTVKVHDSVGAALAAISANEGGLAVVRPPEALPPGLKVLRVARNAPEVAFGPTPENLYSGDYPLRLPVQLVFKRSEAPRLQRLLRFLLSDDLVPVLQESGLVPLPRSVRTQQIFDLELL